MLILGVPCFKELDCRQYGANDLANLDAQHIRQLPCVDLEPGSGGDWMPWSLATSICFFSKENIHHYLPHLFSERTLPGDSSPFELCSRTIFQCIHHSSSAQGLGGAQTFIFQAMIFPGIMRASAVSGIWFKRASS